MFIYETHLPQILRRESYTSEEQHAVEMERLFLPSWHFIGTKGDLPSHGDYLTTTLFDQPLIVWHVDGEIRTFLNVCPHGCIALAREAHGNADHLVCKHHGLKFNGAGRVIESSDPETRALGLKQIRTECCGPLIFVNLSWEAPDLETFVGPMWETMRALFPEDIRDVLTLDYEIEANWKVKVENTLESYHVEMVHSKSFSRMPKAEACREELGFNFSSFHAVEEAPTKLDRGLDRFIHRLAGANLDLTYSHHIVFPQVMFGKLRLLSWIETVYPISPLRHRVHLRSFYRPAAVGKLRSGLAYRLFRAWARQFGRTVSAEDAAIIPVVQKGLASPAAPPGGLLSIREERLYHFQEHIQRETLVLEPLEDMVWSSFSQSDETDY